MLKPIGLIEGHYECRSFDETLPIFTDLLALEVIERKDKQAVVKHPNTEWRLVCMKEARTRPTSRTLTIMAFAWGAPKRSPKHTNIFPITKLNIRLRVSPSPTKPTLLIRFTSRNQAAMTSKSNIIIRPR